MVSRSNYLKSVHETEKDVFVVVKLLTILEDKYLSSIHKGGLAYLIVIRFRTKLDSLS